MFNAKRLSHAALAAIASGTVVVASLAGAGSAAQAVPVHARGYSSVESCTGLTGSISYSPGLVKKSFRTERAVLRGTLSGCSGLSGAQAGTGAVTAVLTGKSKVGSIVETGNVTVNWPASSGLNPSSGTLSVRQAGASAPIVVSGSITAGAFKGAVLSSSLFETGHTGRGTVARPIRRQGFTNVDPLAVRVNFG